VSVPCRFSAFKAEARERPRPWRIPWRFLAKLFGFLAALFGLIRIILELWDKMT
jgi:hypothetical protein